MNSKIVLFSPFLLMATVAACDCGGEIVDDKAPTVSAASPQDAAVNTPVDVVLTVTFSEEMKASTFSNSSITVKAGDVDVAGIVDVDGVTATFTPAEALPLATQVTATVTKDAEDRSGNSLASNFVWSFTTGDTPDLTPPTVLSTLPAADEVAVARRPAARCWSSRFQSQ